MYKYSDEIVFTSMNEVLSVYSQEDIFRIVFKEYPDFNKNYLSPFREDNNPNCFFEWYKGKLLFKDYADIRRDCFHAVKDYFKLKTYNEVYSFIDNYFKTHTLPSVKEYKIAKKQREDNDFYDISIKTRSFEERDYLYWKQFYITREQLESDKVAFISKYRFYSKRKKRWFISRPFDITYAYCEFEKSKKIYRPKATSSKGKWNTNCSSDDIGNINNIDKNLSYLIITKSYKDCRVIRNENYTNTVWFQSEKIIPSDDKLLSLISPFNTIIIFYDNDKTGKTGASDLKARILKLDPTKEVILVFSPLFYCKDPADVVSIKGKSALKRILWKNYQLE